MHLQIDAHACAYGLFQVAFAGLDTRLSRPVAALPCSKNTKRPFAVVKKMPFGQRLQILQRAVEKAVDNGLHIPEMEELKQACKLATDVSKWRNQRIHGEVRFIENQPVILDEEGKPLQIDYDACAEKIQEAIRAGVAMEASVPSLVAYKMDLIDLMDDSS
jgi:hypothetical protein